MHFLLKSQPVISILPDMGPGVGWSRTMDEVLNVYVEGKTVQVRLRQGAD